MTDRPIIFSGPMVLALLSGRKTMTRRLATSPLAKCQPGDRGWVRETWADVNTDSGPALLYRAGPEYHFCCDDAFPVEYDRYPGCHFTMWCGDLLRGEAGHPWRSPIFMPRWASRATLLLTAVKIERLQDITIADAVAEGALESGLPYVGAMTGDMARVAFSLLWDSLHGPMSWEANPSVVAISFAVKRHNIGAAVPTEAERG